MVARRARLRLVAAQACVGKQHAPQFDLLDGGEVVLGQQRSRKVRRHIVWQRPLVDRVGTFFNALFGGSSSSDYATNVVIGRKKRSDAAADVAKAEDKKSVDKKTADVKKATVEKKY